MKGNWVDFKRAFRNQNLFIFNKIYTQLFPFQFKNKLIYILFNPSNLQFQCLVYLQIVLRPKNYEMIHSNLFDGPEWLDFVVDVDLVQLFADFTKA